MAYSELKKSNGILTEGPLDELYSTIFKDPKQLKQFACELVHFEKTEQIAIAMLKEYGNNLEASINIINVSISCTLALNL